MNKLPNINRLVKFLPELLLVVFLIHSGGFFIERANNEPLWKSWGDTFSDSNVMLAGEHFAERGFFKLDFLPTDLNIIKGPYTGWPPLADLANGLLHKLGINSLVGARYLILMISLLFAVYLYRLLALLF